MKKILLLILLSYYMAPCVKAQTTNYQVHALFVMNIAKYSTWPTHTVDFVIAVYGNSKVYDELVKHAAGKNINGQVLKIVQVDELSAIGSPQIVYVSDGKSGSLSDVIKSTEGKPIMLIAEREGLYKKGAGFSWVIMDNNTLRFDINNAELEKRQIKVAKNLTSLANAVL
jgi:hypothetical protein